MLTREGARDEILEIDNPNILCELPTSFGKSKIALDWLKKQISKPSNKTKILIVVPRLVLIQNWKDEFKKWGYEDYLPYVEFITYVSFPKKAGKWDVCIFDECFRGDTEILTDSGYKQFKYLSESDKVAQFTDEGNIEFVNPIRLIKRQHEGKICKLHLGRGRFAYVTPNHNQVFRTKTDKRWRTKEIKDLKFNCLNQIPVSGKGAGDNSRLTPVEKLYIAIQADGTLQRHQVNESVYSIQLTKDRKKNRLKNILNEYTNYTKIKGRLGTDRYMIKLPKGDAKLLSTHFSVNMGYDRAKSFIEEVIEWDGSHLIGSTEYYSSKIKENADFVAAVAVQAGYKVLQSIEKDNRNDNYSSIHRVYMRPNTEAVNTQPMYKKYEDYNDYVYCVEVPSHKIVVRSQGYTFVSGNCHHLSQRCREALEYFEIGKSILLSATVGRELKAELYNSFINLRIYKVTTKQAISDEILPDPKVYLIPLTLDNTNINCEIVKNPSQKIELVVPYAQRFKYAKVKNRRIVIKCTQKQYYNDLTSMIEWYKKKTYSEIFKNMFLRKSGERLKWLSDQKTSFILSLLDHIKNQRTLTFCNSILQTEVLGKYCINSSSKDTSTNNLAKFNNQEVDHITACNMLDEGVNLVNCRVGVYAVLNSSERMIKQKLGRLLRHPNPVIIIPYYEGTRDEELVNKMLEDYNQDLVSKITNLKDLTL